MATYIKSGNGSKSSSGPYRQTTADSGIDPEDIQFLIVHCSATSPSEEANHETIERYHTTARGWPTIGYHYVINRDGNIVNTLPEDQRGIHVAGFNSVSLGICLVGGINEDGVPEANFTSLQFESLEILLRELKGRYPRSEVKGHRDFNAISATPKACPAFNIHVWMDTGDIVEEII